MPRNDMARIIRQVEAEANEEADKRAREVISLAVQRLASEHVSEVAASRGTAPIRRNEGAHHRAQRTQYPRL